MATYTARRAAAKPPPTPGYFQAAASKTYLPASDKLRPLTGYGPSLCKNRSASWGTTAFPVRVIVLDDGHGERLCMVTMDVWSGSTYVLERVSEILTTDIRFRETCIGRDQLFLQGIHTHCAPGGIYESPYYSRLADPFPFTEGFDAQFAERWADTIAQAIRSTCLTLGKATLSTAVATFEGNINRSIHAHRLNPGQDGATEASAVIREVPLVVATRLDGTLIGALGAVGCHATVLPASNKAADVDFLGEASWRAEEALRGGVIALGAGAIGDADPQPPGMSRDQFIALRKGSVADTKAEKTRLAIQLASAVERALKSRQVLEVVRLEAFQSSVPIAGARVGNAQLPQTPKTGLAVVGGSELGRGPALGLEPRRNWAPDVGDPQWPKLMGPASALATSFFANQQAAHSGELNLTLFKLGAVWLVGLPGEPTTQLVRDLEAHLRAKFPHAQRVIVFAVNGGYHGYFPTEREYEAQHYEGASCIWGRYTAVFLLDRLEMLARGQLPRVSDQAVELTHMGPAPYRPTERLRRVGFVVIDLPSREPDADIAFDDEDIAAPLSWKIGTRIEGMTTVHRFLLREEALEVPAVETTTSAKKRRVLIPGAKPGQKSILEPELRGPALKLTPVNIDDD